MPYVICILIGYAIGCINPTFIFGKLKGMDVRKSGSRNPGGSNALMLMGKPIGFACMLLDIAKAYGAVMLTTRLLYPDLYLVFSVTAVSCIAGHLFPFYLRFHGGKGLACIGGVGLAYDWRVFLCILAVEFVIVLITDYIAFIPLTAYFIFPTVCAIREKDVWVGLLFLPVTVVVVIKHIENLRRIRKGTEYHISFLWRKDREIERVEANQNKNEK